MADALRLFIVEDDDDVAFLMRKSLERAGHLVTVCHTGADALMVLGQQQFSLVLLDQRLPDIAGLDLLQTLNKEGINNPVLMVTGVGDEELATQVLRAGALDYIVKDRALSFLADLPKRVLESVTRYRLQQTNRLLIEALESARDGVIITDLQGTLLHVNRAVERMFGFNRQELLGSTPRLFKSGMHSKEYFGEMWRTVLNRTSWQGELVNRRKDGTLLDVSLTVSPLFDAQGQLTHLVGIYRDMTERKQMERQLFQAQKMQSVGTLAGGVAHEFNNLLAGIQGYASLGLREPGVTPILREFLDFIVQLTDRAANLTRQLLAYARKPALSRQPTSIEKLLRTTAQLVEHSLNIEVKLHLEPGCETLTALTDANQLQQVLVNLSLNARDSMTGATPKQVEFRVRHRVLGGMLPAFPQNIPPGDYVVLEVTDHGVGMTPEVLAQAIDPFFTTKEVGQGTGLGLPVAFGIITGHQGFLTIESEKNTGTRVSIYLVRMAPGHTPVEPKERPRPEKEPEKVIGRSILVIDDEKPVQDVIRRFLEIAGHRVTCAASGAEGVEMLKNGFAPDVAILDLMIPREDGPSNFQRLRETQPRLPILLCTGLIQNDLAVELLQQGAVDLLRKPFRMNDLWQGISKAISERSKKGE